MRKYSLQVHLDPALITWVRLEAKRQGVSLGEVVRNAIRLLMDRGNSDKS